jgi:hypothetical protein
MTESDVIESMVSLIELGERFNLNRVTISRMWRRARNSPRLIRWKKRFYCDRDEGEAFIISHTVVTPTPA